MGQQYDLFDCGRDGTTFIPRPYQVDCRRIVEEAWREHDRVLAVVATGLGKTEIFADLIQRADSDGLETLTVIPFIDLTGQTAARYRSRGIACGVEQSTLRSTERHTVACYASLLSRGRWQQYVGRVKRVCIDEVHLNYTKASMKMLDAFLESGARILGMTATPERLGDPITDYYGKPVYTYNYHNALEDGWLVPAKIWLSIMESLDCRGIRKAGSDFDPVELARIMAQERNVQAICSLIEQHYEGLPSLVFCQGIHQADAVHRGLVRRGIWSSIVHSRMEPEERRMHLRDFEEGITKVIVNVGCLCVGWDAPELRKLFIAKPTLSRPKYNQMYGRLVRPWPKTVDGLHSAADRRRAIAESPKPDFEVFDITDSSRHNDLRSAIDVLVPDADPTLVARIKRHIEKKPASLGQLDEIVKAEAEAMAREQAARDAMTEHLRAGMIGHGRFSHYGRDIYATAERPERVKRNYTHMPFGRFKGTAIKSIPKPYIRILFRDFKLHPDLKEALQKRLDS